MVYLNTSGVEYFISGVTENRYEPIYWFYELYFYIIDEYLLVLLL